MHNMVLPMPYWQEIKSAKRCCLEIHQSLAASGPAHRRSGPNHV